jgi:predicted ATPase/class 3 adenylate cyclase
MMAPPRYGGEQRTGSTVAERGTGRPVGTVTLLFSDIAASTRALQAMGRQAYREVLDQQRTILRRACDGNGGTVVDVTGDGLFAAFPSAQAAVRAATEAQARMAGLPIQVRMGIHTGEPEATDDGYVGMDVHRAARICSAAHGGQVLLSAATARLLDDVELVDLGRHRVRDLGGPVQLFQLGTAEHPRPRTLPLTNMPRPDTPLIGRAGDLVRLQKLVQGTRLLTLCGPGGVGKTRLAIQLAAELSPHYPDRLLWVPLAGVENPEAVMPAIGQALGSTDPVATVIGAQPTLMLLDNFEQVADAAPVVGEMLQAAPGLSVVVTSREPLGLAAEQVYRVEPLESEPAVSLFTVRARAQDPGFEPDGYVALICRRVDSLPLAIELASARVGLLGTRGLYERLERRLPLLAGDLRDLPQRHRTLWAAIAWSYELLSKQEQQLLRALSVFAGSFSLTAAEEVCGAELETLDSLVRRSLLQRVPRAGREPRLMLLDTVREFAAEQLAEAGQQSEFAQRHSDFFVELAEQIAAHEMDPDSDYYLRMEAELDNVRAALERARDSDDYQRSVRLVSAMAMFWQERGYGGLPEGVGWITPLLPRRRELARRVRLGLLRAATMTIEDDAQCLALSEERLELARGVGDEGALLGALYSVAFMRASSGDREGASRLLDEMEQIANDSGDESDMAWMLNMRATLAWLAGDHAEQLRLADELLELSSRLGNTMLEAMAEEHRGVAFLMADQHTRALEAFQRALAFEVNRGAPGEWPHLIEGIAAGYASADRCRHAGLLLGAAAALRTGASEPDGPDLILHQRAIQHVNQRCDRKVVRSAIAEGQALPIEGALRIALDQPADP